MTVGVNGVDSRARECIDVVNATHDLCIEVIARCLLDLGGERAANAHIRALLDCVLSCDGVRDSLLQGSTLPGSDPLYLRYCEGCIEAATVCRRSCEQLADGDRLHLECVEQCQRCVQVCSEMLPAGYPLIKIEEDIQR